MTRLIWRRWKGRLPTGIDRVALAYLDHFAPRSQAVVQHQRLRRILDVKASQQLFALLQAPRHSFKRDLVTGLITNATRYGAKGQDRIYLNVGHTGLDSPGFQTWIDQNNVRPIYLVHDLIPISHPQFARANENIRHRNRMRTALLTGTGIIANSRSTLHELEQFAASEALELPATLVAWLGVDQLPGRSRGRPPTKPTFVTIGTIEGRKNHALLLNVWDRMVTRLHDAAPRLLIIGQRGWEAEKVFDRLDADATLNGHVFELGTCSDDELAQHLGSARALLFPSFAEGYGLPLVEALASGVPVIASDLPVFRELCGNIPTYLAPDDESAWEGMICDYANFDSGPRQTQLTRLKAYAAPSWAEHFRSVEQWLARLG